MMDIASSLTVLNANFCRARPSYIYTHDVIDNRKKHSLHTFKLNLIECFVPTLMT